MSIQGWYYLHTGGDLIYKPETGCTHADIRESDFAACMWPMDPGDRAGAWDIAVEGLALGASPARVHELAQKWGLTDEDAERYAEVAGISISVDGNRFCAVGLGFENLQESHAGFGETKLEAMAELAKDMGVPRGTMWRTTFRDMLRATGRVAA